MRQQGAIMIGGLDANGDQGIETAYLRWQRWQASITDSKRADRLGHRTVWDVSNQHAAASPVQAD